MVWPGLLSTWKVLRPCLRDHAAGVALMFAILVIPIIAMVGLAIDLSLVTLFKKQLNAATDAAALAAVRTAADAFSAGRRNYIELGQVAGLQWFNSQSSTMLDLDMQEPEVAVTQSGAVFASRVTYNGMVPTDFARLFGITGVPVGGASSATITTTAYVSVTFLFDNSSSMLLAATQAGVDLMNSITPSMKNILTVPKLGGLPCAFACHWDPNGRDYYGVARNAGVLLRFDVARFALGSAITEILNEELFADQFSVGIYTFGGMLQQVYPSDSRQSFSTDLAGGRTAAQTIQSPIVTYRANTDFPKAMAALASASTEAGDGSSPSSPRKVLIILTDGMADYNDHKGPIDPANCGAIKNLGFNVYVFYTSYLAKPPELLLPLDNIALLPVIDGTAPSTIALALQSCASAPADYIRAADLAGITAAVKQMLRAALGNAARLTE
jgi:hypothetical protein